MKRPLPPLTWFRSFEAAARHLSFTAAAEELGLTQSAISQQVRALEERLGVALFVRKPRGLGLTDDARKLLPKVGSSLDLLESATATFDSGSTQGLLSIAASVSVVRWIIAPRLSEFLIDNPGLRIRLVGTIWGDQHATSMADVEIRFGSAKQAGINATRLLPDALIPVCLPSLLPEWHERPLIEAVGTSEGWTDWAKEAGHAPLADPTILVDSHGAALDLAHQGAGVALTSSQLARQSLRTGDLVAVAPQSLASTEGYFLAARSQSKSATRFSTWIKVLTSSDGTRESVML